MAALYIGSWLDWRSGIKFLRIRARELKYCVVVILNWLKEIAETRGVCEGN